MDNRALTAGELAHAARVSPQTTSSHLVKLTNAKLLQATQQGRHRYYRLASPLVAQMLETVMVVAGDRLSKLPPSSKASEELRAAQEVAMTILPDVLVSLAPRHYGARLYYSRARRCSAHAMRDGFLGRTRT